MTTRKLAALTLAGLLLSAPFAVTADAATRARSATTRHHVAKPVRHSSRAAMSRPRASSDTSADALNAQSLARARGQ